MVQITVLCIDTQCCAMTAVNTYSQFPNWSGHGKRRRQLTRMFSYLFFGRSTSSMIVTGPVAVIHALLFESERIGQHVYVHEGYKNVGDQGVKKKVLPE